MSSEKLDVLALEILKAKYDLKELPIKEIFSAYQNICEELKQVSKKLSSSGMSVLK